MGAARAHEIAADMHRAAASSAEKQGAPESLRIAQDHRDHADRHEAAAKGHLEAAQQRWSPKATPTEARTHAGTATERASEAAGRATEDAFKHDTSETHQKASEIHGGAAMVHKDAAAKERMNTGLGMTGAASRAAYHEERAKFHEGKAFMHASQARALFTPKPGVGAWAAKKAGGKPAKIGVKEKAPKGTPTSTNIFAGKDLMKKHGGVIPSRVPSVDHPHITRLLKAGYIEKHPSGGFVPTAEHADKFK
jgi:hypothetical protein